MQTLSYTPTEHIAVVRPVHRVAWIVEQCRNRRILDLGGYDETAQIKRGTGDWLHGAIAEVASSVLGVDSSPAVPREGVRTGPRSRIVPGDVLSLDPAVAKPEDFDVVVAGELIEHLPDTLGFLTRVREIYAGRAFIATTPNATSLTNVMLAPLSRESNHHDHLQVYSYKTLNTLATRAGFREWELLPYHVYYREMILRSSGVKRAGVQAVERMVNIAESAWPMLSGGLILHVKEL